MLSDDSTSHHRAVSIAQTLLELGHGSDIFINRVDIWKTTFGLSSLHQRGNTLINVIHLSCVRNEMSRDLVNNFGARESEDCSYVHQAQSKHRETASFAHTSFHPPQASTCLPSTFVLGMRHLPRSTQRRISHSRLSMRVENIALSAAPNLHNLC